MLRQAIQLLLIGLSAGAAAGQQQPAAVYVTGDVGITSVRAKMRYGNGIGPATPIMQNQNWSGFESKTLLMAFDTKRIRGWTVSKAVLHLHLAKGDLYGVGLCTVLGDWTEGKALNWVELPGAPCWDFARTPPAGTEPASDHYWSWAGSKFDSVCWSHPAGRYSNAGPGQIQREKTKNGRFLHLKVPVDPALVESLAAGLASGLVLTDDKGQVRESYSLIGGAMPYRYNASEDAWVFTKDIQDGKYRPWLEVFGEAKDKTPPAAPKGLKTAGVSPADGSVVLEFTAPGDDGSRGSVLGYEAACSPRPISEDNWAQATHLPRWSLPKPVAGGQTQRMPLFTLGAGKTHVAVRGVDEAGNRGAIADVAVTVPPPPRGGLARLSRTRKAPGSRARTAAGGRPPRGKLTVLPCSEMVKADPVTGWLLRDGEQARADALDKANPVWDAAGKRVRLTAAANEVAAFQLLLGSPKGALKGIGVTVSDLAGAGGKTIPADPNVRLYRLWYVNTGAPPARTGTGGELTASTWHGDACLPLAEPFGKTFDIPAADNKVPGQTCQSVWADVYVPRGTAAGRYTGQITISAGGLDGPVKLELRLEVLPLSLPDRFSWVVEINRYHSIPGWAGVNARRDPEQALKTVWDYYGLAHSHRCVLNVLPYSHSGRVDGDAIPVMEGEGTARRVKDWTQWDKQFAPLLDGSAFSAKRGYVGPGAGVPINHMYMAFHEAWPMPINKQTYVDWEPVNNRLEFAEYAKKARRPDVAFTEDYKKGFIAVARQFFEHFKAKGWTGTEFQFYNNNKYYWKVAYFGGMGRGGASFWLMDEPSDFDDYDANGFIMNLARLGWRAAEAPQVRMAGRTDVSQPEMVRGLWDHVANVWCLGGWQRFAPTAAARRRWLPDETHWCYGGGARIAEAPVRQLQRALTRWWTGMEGWMPYWNAFDGHAGAWRGARDMAVYYTGQNYAGTKKTYPGPIASLKLKHFRRCQQDVEYIHLLAQRKGWDRHRVRRALLEYADDPKAPVPTFDGLSFDRMLQLRQRLIDTILGK